MNFDTIESSSGLPTGVTSAEKSSLESFRTLGLTSKSYFSKVNVFLSQCKNLQLYNGGAGEDLVRSGSKGRMGDIGSGRDAEGNGIYEHLLSECLALAADDKILQVTCLLGWAGPDSLALVGGLLTCASGAAVFAGVTTRKTPGPRSTASACRTRKRARANPKRCGGRSVWREFPCRRSWMDLCSGGSSRHALHRPMRNHRTGAGRSH